MNATGGGGGVMVISVVAMVVVGTTTGMAVEVTLRDAIADSMSAITSHSRTFATSEILLS